MTDCCDTFTITSDCYTIELGMPIWGGENNAINKDLKRFQFWLDNYAVDDTGIDSQPLSLIGIESVCGEGSSEYAKLCFPICFPLCFETGTGTEATSVTDMHEKFIQLDEIMDNHEEVTITGLGDCMNAVYIIRNLKVDTIPKYGERALSWTLVLEKVRDI